MKRPLFTLALAVCAGSLLQAAQLYDITLYNAQKYSQCTILYGGKTMTKFTGKDSSGAVVTMEIKTASILFKKPVAPDVPATTAPEPQPSETPATETQEQATESTPDTSAASAEAPQSNDSTNTETPQQAEPPIIDEYATESAERTAKAKDATLRLREKLAKVDTEFSHLSKPTQRLKSACSSGKNRVERDLEKMDKLAIEVANLQEQYNNNTSEYTFAQATAEQRYAYVQNGQAAHKAMLVDMKQRKGSRKIGGLDKFELMRDRYQGIPEYKQAYEWYVKTLNDLEKRWEKMYDKEEKARKKLLAAKKEVMRENDEKEFEKLSDQLEKEGEDIARVWFNPSPRNMKMLQTALNKVKNAKRLTEHYKLSDQVGTVPSLIEQYWTAMDEARRLMVAGDFTGAENTLDSDPAYKSLNSMNRQLLPEEFKKPLVEQRRDIEQEIRKRSRAHNLLKNQLERKISELERATNSADSQLNALLEQIEREKELDTGDNTIDLKQQQEDNKETTPEPPASASTEPQTATAQ